MAVRYDMRPETDGWTVYDINTGLPAAVNGERLTRLPLEDADDLADLLNGLHTQQLAAASH